VRDAMARLLDRAKAADPEILAGLVTTCRYCGLLDASAAAHTRAVGLEPHIKTSVPHTWFLLRDYSRVAAVKFAEYPYLVALAMMELGRGQEALTQLRETGAQTRVPGYVVAAQTLIEGKNAESIAALQRVLASGFSDPEGLFYAARHLAHLGEADVALSVLERVVNNGFFCYPAMTSDPWLAGLKKR